MIFCMRFRWMGRKLVSSMLVSMRSCVACVLIFMPTDLGGAKRRSCLAPRRGANALLRAVYGPWAARQGGPRLLSLLTPRCAGGSFVGVPNSCFLIYTVRSDTVVGVTLLTAWRVQWLSGFGWVIISPGGISLGMLLTLIVRIPLHLVCLCVVASACSPGGAVLSSPQGVPVERARFERPLRGDVQSAEGTCRGFLVFCPMWTVYWVQDRAVPPMGGSVYARGSDAPSKLFP